MFCIQAQTERPARDLLETAAGVLRKRIAKVNVKR
jgi:hypothetical protein